jgi:hypothetical protein
MAIMTRLVSGSGALLALGVLIGISACGAERSAGGSTGTPPTSVSPPPPSSTPATPATPATPGQTLSGVIIEGIRPGCRVLQTSQRRYALVGATTPALHLGDKVTVTGVERSDLVNPCGLTFVVAAIS